MKTLQYLSLTIVLFICTSFVSFHHGWASYDQNKVIDFKTTIDQLVFENPHALARVKYNGNAWTVYLAPTSRMVDRGLSAEMLSKGTSVRIVAYPHKTIKSEMRAERIYVGEKKVELR